MDRSGASRKFTFIMNRKSKNESLSFWAKEVLINQQLILAEMIDYRSFHMSKPNWYSEKNR